MYNPFRRKPQHRLRNALLILVALAGAVSFIVAGVFLLWASTLTMPSLDTVNERRSEQATKLYDRTGEILLYDMHQDVKRTVVKLDQMSPHVLHATIAIEDANFYHHLGIEPLAIVRAIVRNLIAGDLLGGQGGSTLTQQVVKNSLLVREKTVSRKFKEWVLAIKLERLLSKDAILELYLNEVPYGGNKYGVEEASQGFFGKPAKDLDIAESAYLAALPQAPTYYAPHGNNRTALDQRKNLVLERMFIHGYITKEERDAAQAEEVTFRPHVSSGIKAPHFVFHVISELTKQYGEDELAEAGLKVITTLDWELQREAEAIVYKAAHENASTFNASNASLMAIDPRSGDILVMVGSRDYFDEEIDGNFNIGLANRQPGSAFKPFAYATALKKGYTTETVVFDVHTQFSTACEKTDLTSEDGCYAPTNYDDKFRGPISFRNALAQSINVPAVKALYLAGMKETIETAQRMGISTLTDWRRYGLTLVLGGGEVSLLEMTSAYGVFAHEGTRFPHHSVLRIEDASGKTIDTYEPHSSSVLDRDVALQITDMLADNDARTPAFGSNSFLNFPGTDVAVKTGTTNDYRDAWIIGYTPEIAVGAWAGNNDNSPMEKKVAGFIIAPMWHEFFQAYLKRHPDSSDFAPPPVISPDLKPILRGRFEGGQSAVVDRASGKLATDETPPEMRQEVFVPNMHSILHWVNKDDPRGPVPSNPASDPQYEYWEYGVLLWKGQSGMIGSEGTGPVLPDGTDDVHNEENKPKVSIRNPDEGKSYRGSQRMDVRLNIDSTFEVTKVDYFVNGRLIGSADQEPFSLSFTPDELEGIEEENTLMVIVYDEVLNRGGASVSFTIR